MSGTNNFITTANKIIWPVLAFFLAAGLCYFLWPVILPFFFSMILGYLLGPIIDFLEFRGINRTLAIGITYILIIVCLFFPVKFLISGIVYEINNLKDQLPTYLTQIQEQIATLETTMHANIPATKNLNLTEKIIDQSNAMTQAVFDGVPILLKKVFSLFYMIILIPFITFFFLKDGYIFKKKFISFIPNKFFEMSLGLSFRLEQQLGYYITAKIVQMILIMIIVSTGLLIINVPYAILLGIFAGITNLIPYIGPYMGSIPALIIVLMNGQGLVAVGLVLIVVIVAHVLDNLFIQPLIIARSIDMHPIMVIAALTFGGYVAGIWGMLLAEPVVGMLKIIVEDVYKEMGFRLPGGLEEDYLVHERQLVEF